VACGSIGGGRHKQYYQATSCAIAAVAQAWRGAREYLLARCAAYRSSKRGRK